MIIFGICLEKMSLVTFSINLLADGSRKKDDYYYE